MTSPKQMMREQRRKKPKTFAAIDRRWDMKMLHDVMHFAMGTLKYVNPRLKKLARKEEWIIDANEVEHKLWPLLAKLRRITQAENKYLRDRLKAANELLRSTHSIAERKGNETNWEPFLARVKEELEIEHKIMYKRKRHG